MALFDGKFDSAKQDWTTPNNLFSKLNTIFNFNFDLAASEENKKCNDYYSETDDALSKTWKGRCWLNPPYGGKTNNKLELWIKKAYTESLKDDCFVVMLIPTRTNTNWWHKYCMNAKEVYFIKGRPKFGDAKHGLPQPLALIYFDGNNINCSFKTFEI